MSSYNEFIYSLCKSLIQINTTYTIRFICKFHAHLFAHLYGTRLNYICLKLFSQYEFQS